MREFLRSLVAVSAFFALSAIGICAVEAARLMEQSQAAVADARAQINAIGGSVQATTASVGASVVQLEGIIGDERAAQKRQTIEFNKALAHLSDVLAHTDLTLNGNALHPGAIAQMVNNTTALVPMAEQAQRDLADLDPVIKGMVPLVDHTSGIAANLQASTADVEHEIHKLVYPPPRKWYQKYFLDPLKIAAHLVTIPVR